MKRELSVAMMLTLGFASAAFAETKTFTAKPNGWSRVTFESDAPIESIVGVSTKVEGTIEVDPAAAKEGTKGKIEIDVASLNTGIALRDDHLRSKMWLDAEAHPKLTFELEKIKGIGALKAGKYVKGKARGKLTVKGQTREVTLPVRVGLFEIPEGMKKQMPELKGDLLRVSTQFELKLSDYGVQVPAMLGMKVSDKIKIRVDVSALSM
ncbi:MAG: YceI family protein [Deltaproteobacteria bacterium]|nr:YceI family protein [Deltaproteobacteria bacterium]